MKHASKLTVPAFAAGVLAVGLALPNAARAQEDNVYGNAKGFFLEPEVVLMQFRGTELEYAAVDSSVQEVDTEYEVGWRLGLGYRWENHWDITLRGSVLEAEDEHFTDDSKGDLVSLVGFGGDADEAFARVDQELGILDIEIGRMWGDDGGRWARVFFGPRAANYELEQSAVFSGEDFGTGSNADFVVEDLDVEMIGIRAGIEGHATIGAGWSFFGWSGLSVLMGDFDGSRFEEEGGGILEDSHDDFDGSVTALEAGLGFSWLHEVGDDWSFGLRFGYELQNWTDLIATSLQSSGNDEDLGVDGGFLRASFLF